MKLDKAISIGDLHQQWEKIIQKPGEGPYLVTREGKPFLIILSIEDYEDLIDAKLAASPLFGERITEAKANYESGQGGSYETLRRDLLTKAEETDVG